LAYPDDKNTEAKVEDYEILPGETKQTKSSEFIYVSLPSGVMNVKWTPNTDDAVAYRLYWGDSSGHYGEKIEISGRDAAAGQSYKEATFNYISTLGTIFMAISSVDAAGNESGKSAEVSVRGY